MSFLLYKKRELLLAQRRESQLRSLLGEHVLLELQQETRGVLQQLYDKRRLI